MQTGYATSGATTGWGGRMLDQLEAYNEGADFPVAISMDKPALYCSGVTTQDITLQPGNTLQQQGLGASSGGGGAGSNDGSAADPRRGRRQRDDRCGE